MTAVPISTRRLALALVLIAQTAIFVVFLPRPLQVVNDNVRYEVAGYNLAQGEGLSLPTALQPDPEVREWACSRHPAWCTGDSVPTAMYPPGYQFYIAAIYLFAGRSLAALFFSQFLLLLAMFWAFEKIAARYLDRAGYLFAMVIAATYPFLAYQAAFVMSDHLHAVLVLFALAVVLLHSASLWRGLCCGLLLAAATLTRPYSFVCLPFVILALAWRPRDPKWGIDLSGMMAGILLPFAGWIVRNAIVFGRFIQFSTAGIGASLYYNKMWWTIGSTYSAANARAASDELKRVAGGEPLAWHANHVLTAASLDWMKTHPWQVLASLPLRAVRLWISLGTSGEGISRAWPLLISYLGGLLVLGLAGMWIRRRRREVLLLAAFILPYWGFLLHTPAEARRTLALRLPLLLCAGMAVDAFACTPTGRRILNRWRTTIHAARSSSSAGDPS